MSGSDTQSSRSVRIVGWNCNQALARKAGRLLVLRPDIVVVPECADRTAIDGLELVAWVGRKADKGLGVFARPELGGVVDPSWDRGREWFIPVRFDDLGLDVLAVWAMNHRGQEAGNRRGRTHRALEHYGPFLQDGRAVVIGDFNDNARWDTPAYPSFARTTAILEAAGYANLYHARTAEAPGFESAGSLFWYRHRDRPYLVDHAFVPRDRLPFVRAYHLGRPEEWLDVSDHVPIVVELDLPTREAAAPGDKRRTDAQR